VTEVVEPKMREAGALERATKSVARLPLIVWMIGVVREEPHGFTPPTTERLLLEPEDVAVELAEEVRRQVDGAAVVRLGRFDAAEVDGALDLERLGPNVDVAQLQREGLARTQPRLGEHLEDDEEPTLLLRGLEEACPLLPGHGLDLLRAVGGRDCARRSYGSGVSASTCALGTTLPRS
jgi:hypothetical protein